MGKKDRESLKRELEATEEDIRRLERQEEERKERHLDLDDEIEVKSKLAERDIIDSQKKKKDADEPDRKGPQLFFTPIQPERPASMAPRQNMGSTGAMAPPQVPPISAMSLGGIIQEALTRRMGAKIQNRAESGRFNFQDMFDSMWAVKQSNVGRQERMIHDLRTIEERTPTRITRLNELNLKRIGEGLSVEDDKELKSLEKEEVMRYWIRQNTINELPLYDQERMNWLRPIGEGAYGVVPYTVVTKWDLLTLNQKAGVRWLYDNTLLRWQRSISGGFIPKAAKLSWFKKQKQKGVEKLFDDIDEEIYSDKKFQEMMKKGQAQLENMEEELSGYDRFTVEEEKEIQKRVAAIMSQALALAKEEEMYG